MSDYPALARDARALSSGTLSYLVNDTRYVLVDQVQAEFVEFCEENPHFENWIDAWESFCQVFDIEKFKLQYQEKTP